MTCSLIIGASAGVGRALAERLAADGHDLFLVASDPRDLAATASDLRLRFGRRVFVDAIDLASFDPAALREQVLGSLGGLDNLFYVAGMSTMDSGPRSDQEVVRIAGVNFTAAVRVVNAFLGDLSGAEPRNLVGVGSVAAMRGRGVNTVYAAAKSGLETYFGGMRHYLAGGGCRVQFYRLGYVRTRMTFGQKLPFPALTPEEVASAIAGNLNKDLGAVYLPWWWAVIAMIIRSLPWPVFRRMKA